MRTNVVAAIAVSLLIARGGEDAGAESQNYEQIRADVGLTASMVGVEDRKGNGLVVEIKAMVADYLAIGGRVEIAVMYGGVIGNDDLPVDISMAASGLLEAEAFLGSGVVRPFVGLGVGGYTIGGHSIDSGPNTSGIYTQTGRYFGVAPQVGVDIGRVRLAATYNAILGATLEVEQTVGGARETIDVSQNYLSVELSFQFAGGRKSRVAPATSSSRR